MSKKIPVIEVISVILTYCYPKKKNHLTTPPPRNVAGLRLWVIPENFCYYPPPPLNLPGLRRSRKISATTPPPLNLPGLRRSRKISATTPPPHWICQAYGDPGKFLLLPPPPLNLPGLRRSRKTSATTPPPPNLVGLRRPRKIGPPQKKILATPLLTTNLAAVVCVCGCVSVCKIWPISARTLLFRIHTSRKFCSHSKIPIRCLCTAFCVPLSFIFYEKQWFRMQIVTLRRSRSPLCGR